MAWRAARHIKVASVCNFVAAIFLRITCWADLDFSTRITGLNPYWQLPNQLTPANRSRNAPSTVCWQELKTKFLLYGSLLNQTPARLTISCLSLAADNSCHKPFPIFVNRRLIKGRIYDSQLLSDPIILQQLVSGTLVFKISSLSSYKQQS